MKVLIIDKPEDCELLVGEALLQQGKVIQSQNWQSMGKEQAMFEVKNLSFELPIPKEENLIEVLKPNIPWANNHFIERVSTLPLNPGESYKLWPFYGSDTKVRNHDEKFSHTYMERFWPKYAGGNLRGSSINRVENTHIEAIIEAYAKKTGSLEVYKNAGVIYKYPMQGIRFNYGDLKDVINLLRDEPTTRQAFLPVWFPEDTGAVHKQRVPCTLGYLFNINFPEMTIDVTYYMRSCDYFRHFIDDIYLAIKLLYYIKNALHESIRLTEGNLYFHCRSLHIFAIEQTKLKNKLNKSWEEKGKD